MKKISTFINENAYQLDDQWLNDEKPVRTNDGRQVIITDIDRSKIPNVIKGKVKMGNELYEFTWEETGKCLTAVDQYGNSKQPSNGDKLVKSV